MKGCGRKIIHIDMDCFYAAIEMRDFPYLKDKPVAVGGDSNRGVIATCNYKARTYGVRSAMPTAIAKKKCPQLVLQPVRMDIYKQESAYIRQIFQDYTDKIEPLSLDEAYLDVSDCKLLQGSATLIAKEIRQRIYQTRKLTASAGVAPNKSLAKIASDWHKPNGQMVIRPQDIDRFMQTLPVRKLFGVGPVMESRLHALAIKNCKQLQAFGLKGLVDHFGNFGERLYILSKGVDERPVNPVRIRKSISVEQTYAHDLQTVEACIEQIPSLLESLTRRLERLREEANIHQLFVKVKFNDFHQTTVERVTEAINSLLIKQLLQEGWHRRCLPVRLLGLGIKLHSPQALTSRQLTFPDF